VEVGVVGLEQAEEAVAEQRPEAGLASEGVEGAVGCGRVDACEGVEALQDQRQSSRGRRPSVFGEGDIAEAVVEGVQLRP
jgi:hypothetical protein